MWFKFPRDTTAVSVEMQEFVVEVWDEAGRGYFRAPDHFAGRILDLPGFGLADNLPADAPEDLPKYNPEKEANTTLLTGKVNLLSLEMESLRANFTTVSYERDELKMALYNAEAKISQLEEELGKQKEEEGSENLEDLSSLVEVADKKRKN